MVGVVVETMMLAANKHVEGEDPTLVVPASKLKASRPRHQQLGTMKTEPSPWFQGHGQEQDLAASDVRQVLKARTIQIKELGNTRQWWQALKIV